MIESVIVTLILWATPIAPEECDNVFYTKQAGVVEVVSDGDGITCVLSLTEVGSVQETLEDKTLDRGVRYESF